MSKHLDKIDNPFVHRFARGIETFRRLFIHWMDTNRWSHPIMIRLSRHALDGIGWLHSSQISALRVGELHNPGPRTFIAIAELNKAIYRYRTTKALVPGTKTDIDYLQGYAITTAEGEVPDASWWYSVFIGDIIPSHIPLEQQFDGGDDEAAEFSERFARYMRALLTSKGFDVFTDLKQAIHRHYPACEDSRAEKLAAVLHNKAVWTAAEAEVELDALVGMSTQLGGPASPQDLLDKLR